MKSFRTVLSQNDINNEETMKQLRDEMDAMQGLHDKFVKNLTKELNVSVHCANDIVYLRSRSRWTQELEDELIKLHKEGNPPNIFEFGNPRKKA
jgi:hypothetical protein